ncbi:MAG: hypothetical protein FWC43_07445 [Planctomycetaceae bacterium]|nr:hypothetical protein [Planctomycetaceae bacterium]
MKPISSSLVPYLTFLICTFAFFRDVLFGTAQFAHRDGAHFYYPLYRYIQEELAAGRLPLWMPYEDLGQPLVGNPVAGLFYPGKLLFFLPLDFTTLYHWFIVLHVFCAAVTMYRLVRFYGKSEAAATFAAITYAFGGSVLFQHSNVIFLIGAAWFPELIRQTLRQKQTQRFSCGPPILIALMLLGGDVQAAYHAGLVVLFILGPKKSVGPLLLAFLLTAIQVLPAWELSRESDRAQAGIPRSVWEVPFAKNTHAVFNGLLCRNFDQGEHAKTIYDFSVPPWRLAEMVWPNIAGKPFPENTRWFSMSPYDDFTWVPSLYCGILGLIFAVIGSFQRRFLALVFLVLVVASLGWFGISWLFGTEALFGPPVGGVYWLMNLLLPGYTQFRYPAKLLTLAAVPFAVLAAYGFDRVTNREQMSTSRERERAENKIPLSYVRGSLLLALTLVFISFVLLVVLLVTPLWGRIAENVPVPAVFGPLQAEKAKLIVACSFLQTIVVLVVFGAWASRPHVIQGQTRHPRSSFLLILLCFLDLYLANHWMIPMVDRQFFAQQSMLLEKIVQTHNAPQPPRIYRFATSWYPPQILNQTSTNRFEELVVFDRESLLPRYPLEKRISIIDVPGTMSIHSYLEKLNEIRFSTEFEKSVARLGVEYVILPLQTNFTPQKAVELYSDSINDVALWQIKQPGPVAWTIDGRVAQIISYEPNRIVLETETAQPQTLVLVEQYFPGWKAKVVSEQGECSAKIFPVEKIFRGIEIPAGKCRVEFCYDPFLLKLGAFLTLLGWIFVLYRNVKLRASQGEAAKSEKSFFRPFRA